mgnify:CR=1 FL=1
MNYKRGTPQPVIQRLNQETAAILKSPEIEKRLRGEGAEPVLKSPEELGKYVLAEMDKWVKLAKAAIKEHHKDPADRDLAMCQKLLDDCMGSADYIEGRHAFMEKRRAQFKGR